MADGALNAQDLANELHGLSGLPVVVAGIDGDSGPLRVCLGWAGANTSDVEAIAAAMLLACKDALEVLAPSTPSCLPQLERVTASLDMLRPLASAQPKRELH